MNIKQSKHDDQSKATVTSHSVTPQRSHFTMMTCQSDVRGTITFYDVSKTTSVGSVSYVAPGLRWSRDNWADTLLT